MIYVESVLGLFSSRSFIVSGLKFRSLIHFNYYLPECILTAFLLSSSATPMIRMLGHLTLSQRSLRLSSFLLILFSFFLSASLISTILSSTSLILSSASVILLLVPSGVLLISVIALFIIDQLIFISSRFWLNISCIFSILVSRLFICKSTLFSRFCIIYYHYSEFFFK